MTLQQLHARLTAAGLPSACPAWPSAQAPPLPYAVYRVVRANNFAADGEVYYSAPVISLELYTRGPDPAAQAAAEQALAGTVWQRQAAQLSALDLTIFENVAWLMLRHAGEPVPDSPEEWLDSIPGVLDVYEALPAVLALWGGAQATTATPKKK